MKIYITFLFTLFLISFLQADRAVPYTGKLSIDDINFDGTAKFRFEIIDQAGSQLWAHSNSSQSSAIEVTVNGGRYSVLLGGQGMNPLPPKLFLDNPNLFLKVHFDSGDGKGMRHLAPDISISANAFSLASEWSKYAELASGVPSGSITKEMLSSGLRSELDLNNSLKSMQFVEGHVFVSYDYSSQKNQIHLYDLEKNRTELLTSFEFPDGGYTSYTSFTDDSVLNLYSARSYLRYDINTRTFLPSVVLPSQISSPFHYEDSIVGISYDSSLQKNQIFVYDIESNSSKLLETFNFPNNSWSRMTSFAHNDTLWLDAGGGYISYNVKERKFSDLTSLTNSFQMVFAYEDNLIGVSYDHATQKNQIHLLDLDTNQTKLLSTFEFPGGSWVTYNSFIDGDILRLKSGRQFINFDLTNNQFTAPTNITPIAQSIFPYSYEANVGIITKDMLSPALRTELFPPPTYESQINGTLENPYGWDGEIVIGTLDANYTVPAGKVLVVTSTVSDIFSDEIVFKNQRGNAFVPAGIEIGGRFTGLLFDEIATLTPVVATSVSNGEIVYNVPSDTLFVITGSAVSRQSSSTGFPEASFTLNSKAALAGLGGVVIAPPSSIIRSGATESSYISAGLSILTGSSSGFNVGGFTGYLISPEDLKKLR